MPKRTTRLRYHPIAGFPAYRVGRDGSVWSRYKACGGLTSRWRRLTPSPLRRGNLVYEQVQLYSAPRKGRGFAVHRLVLEAFVGPCPPKMCAHHRDGNLSNNHLTNLFWGRRQPLAQSHCNMTARERPADFGTRLCELRLAASLSQIELARRAGLYVKTIVRLELGRTQPLLPTLERLAAALEMDCGRFIELTTNSGIAAKGA
jgi:DNA-binding XRE family transcriptional regulator